MVSGGASVLLLGLITHRIFRREKLLKFHLERSHVDLQDVLFFALLDVVREEVSHHVVALVGRQDPDCLGAVDLQVAGPAGVRSWLQLATNF